jgi:hypothetical protein
MKCRGEQLARSRLRLPARDAQRFPQGATRKGCVATISYGFDRDEEMAGPFWIP